MNRGDIITNTKNKTRRMTTENGKPRRMTNPSDGRYWSRTGLLDGGITSSSLTI